MKQPLTKSGRLRMKAVILSEAKNPNASSANETFDPPSHKTNQLSGAKLVRTKFVILNEAKRS